MNGNLPGGLPEPAVGPPPRSGYPRLKVGCRGSVSSARSPAEAWE